MSSISSTIVLQRVYSILVVTLGSKMKCCCLGSLQRFVQEVRVGTDEQHEVQQASNLQIFDRQNSKQDLEDTKIGHNCYKDMG